MATTTLSSTASAVLDSWVGGHDIRWVDEEMADVFVGKAEQFIEENADRPFFLFFSSHNIHVPRAPNSRFVGSTPHGPRGDAMVEFDDTVGAIVSALERAGVADNTLVVVTSDNGPVLDDGYKDYAVKKLGQHKPAGPYAVGSIATLKEVPEYRQSPIGRSVLSRLFPTHLSLRSTFQRLLQVSLGCKKLCRKMRSPDSLDLSSALLGDSVEGREYLIEHAGSLSIRVEDWKYIAPSNGAAKNWNTRHSLGQF